MTNVKFAVSGQFSDIRLRRKSDGAETVICEAFPNLITNVGLDMPAAYSWWGCFRYLMIGTGSTPATYGDTTLEAQTFSTNTYSATENGRTADLANHRFDIWTTFVLAGSDSAAITFREMAVGPDGTAAFNRIVFPSDVTIPIGYDLIAKYTLRLGWSNWRVPTAATISWTNTATPPVATTVQGETMFGEQGTGTNTEAMLRCISGSRTSVGTDNHLEPSRSTAEVGDGLYMLTSHPPALSSATDLNAWRSAYVGTVAYGETRPAYVSGTQQKHCVYTVPAADYSGNTLYGWFERRSYRITFSIFPNSFAVFRADAGFTKIATDSLTITTTLSWGRA